MSGRTTFRFDLSADVPPAAELGRVHLVAIGGSGMSGVARMLLAAGVPVSGSDRTDSPTLRALEAEGARVFVGHDAAHLEGVSTVVVSSAIPEDNPELAAARELGLRVLHRAQGIAALLHGRPAVAVAGANGKTTTSAMTTVALQAAGLEPGYVIGAPLSVASPQTGAASAAVTVPPDGTPADATTIPTNAAPGAPGAPVVVEADESDGTFVVYRPQVAVVTNVQADHLDFYGTVEEVERAYAEFVDTVQPGGLLVTNADDPGAARLAAHARHTRPDLQVLTWGTGTGVTGGDDEGAGADPDVLMRDVTSRGMTARATLWMRSTVGPFGEGQELEVVVPVPGEHNAHNATAALLAATVGLGADPERVLAGLAAFPGAHRRFERVGAAGGVEVVDDYAHNAPKVAAVVAAARSAADGRRVVVAFQPHLFSRTQDFADGFAAGLAGADVLVLVPIYGAREKQEQYPQVTAQLLADRVEALGGPERVVTAGSLEATPGVLAEIVRTGDLVVTVGAGDVTTVGPLLLELLGDRVGSVGAGVDAGEAAADGGGVSRT
ncbi:UDP-N-acetylmuramate--L-alanine ligase [Ornithinimicrobium sp. W1665]|uniref:UDP-N-acetylmuramate--L-alanine ligase n=1 Tax=Ornithinimicrobium sp. W1665 TaxID=3416666 RepID=UPI003CF29C8C